MILSSIRLGNQIFELKGVADIYTKKVEFQAVVNGNVKFSSEDYEKARAELFEAVRVYKENLDKAH